MTKVTIEYLSSDTKYETTVEELSKYGDNFFIGMLRTEAVFNKISHLLVFNTTESEQALKYLLGLDNSYSEELSRYYDSYLVDNYSYHSIFQRELHIRNNMYSDSYREHQMNTGPYYNLIKLSQEVWDNIEISGNSDQNLLFDTNSNPDVMFKRSWEDITTQLSLLSPLFDNFNNIVVAGGYLVSTLFGSKTHDIDIFFYGIDKEQADSIIIRFDQIYDNRISRNRQWFIRTTNTVTYHNPINPVNNDSSLDYQFILRLYRQPHEVIHGFDVDCCCIMYDGKDIWCTERFMHSITNRVNVFNKDLMSPSYEYRLAKYGSKGFPIYVEDFDRNKVDTDVLYEIYENQFMRMGKDTELYYLYMKLFKIAYDYEEYTEEVKMLFINFMNVCERIMELIFEEEEYKDLCFSESYYRIYNRIKNLNSKPINEPLLFQYIGEKVDSRWLKRFNATSHIFEVFFTKDISIPDKVKCIHVKYKYNNLCKTKLSVTSRYNLKRYGLSLLLCLETKFLETSHFNFVRHMNLLSNMSSDYGEFRVWKERNRTTMDGNSYYIPSLKDIDRSILYNIFVPLVPFNANKIDFIGSAKGKVSIAMDLPDEIVKCYTDVNVLIPVGATTNYKVINPGEQTTSTFHRTVLDNMDYWYHDHLGNKELEPIYNE